MAVILSNIVATYQTIALPQVLAFLNFKTEAELRTFLKDVMKWPKDSIQIKDATFTLPSNKDNTMKPAVIQEKLQVERKFIFFVMR